MAEEKVRAGLLELSCEEITFRRGDVLTQQALSLTYQYPREFFAARYAGFTAGIICGFDFRMEGGGIYLTPGIVKTGGKYFLLSEKCDFTAAVELALHDALAEGRAQRGQAAKICLMPMPAVAVGEAQVRKYTLQLVVLEAAAETSELAIELGRLDFVGLEPPQLPGKLSDLTSPGIKLLIGGIPYVTPEGRTLPPLYWRILRETLQAKKPRDMLDTMLLMQLAANEVVPLPVLWAYLEGKGLSPQGLTDAQKLATMFEAACKKTLAAGSGVQMPPAKAKPHKETRGSLLL